MPDQLAAASADTRFSAHEPVSTGHPKFNLAL